MSVERDRVRSDHSGARRQRVKQRVQRRFRVRRWRRLVVGMSVLLAAGAVIGAAVWGGVYLVNAFRSERRVEPVELPPGEPLSEPRLIGAWQSDADVNVAETRRKQAVSQTEERDLRDRVFKTKITYTDKMMATETDGDPQIEAYRVIAKNGDEVVIKTWFNERHQEEDVTIRFVGRDVYWADAPQFGLHECFRRIRHKPEMK